MDEFFAREILEIDKKDIITPELCKKKYKKMALKYHPDKNPSEDASLQFIKINEAYHYLNKEQNEFIQTDYKSLFLSFIKNIWGGNGENETLFNIFVKISSLCNIISQDEVEPIIKKMVEKVDKKLEKKAKKCCCCCCDEDECCG